MILTNVCNKHIWSGSVAGVYVGTEYGIERIRGTRDWVLLRSFVITLHKHWTIHFFCNTYWFGTFCYQKNAMLAGAATGAVISAATNKGKDKVVVDAIMGGALATASQFLNNHYFYWVLNLLIRTKFVISKFGPYGVWFLCLFPIKRCSTSVWIAF